MSKLQEFLADAPKESKPEGIEWYAAVQCQTCGIAVDDQTLYPADKVLVWQCSRGHKSFIEGYSVF